VCANLRFRRWGAGEGAAFPCISNREAARWSEIYFHPGTETLRELRERMRMKFSAGFLQWEPSEAFRGYEFNRQTRDVLNQNLEPQDVLCFPNECSDEVWNKGSQEGSPIRVSPKQSQPLQDVHRQGG